MAMAVESNPIEQTLFGVDAGLTFCNSLLQSCLCTQAQAFAAAQTELRLVGLAPSAGAAPLGPPLQAHQS